MQHPELSALPRRRALVDRATRLLVGMGGAGVIVAIALIFFYLLWVVLPIFLPASVTPQIGGETPDFEAPVYLDTDDGGNVGMVIQADGRVRFLALEDDLEVLTPEQSLNRPVIAITADAGGGNLYALLDTSGDVLFFRVNYRVSFDETRRQITPSITYPFEESPVTLGEFKDFEFHRDGSELLIGVLAEGSVRLLEFTDVEDGFPLEAATPGRIGALSGIDHLILGPSSRWLYLLGNDGRLELYDIRKPRRPKHVHSQRLLSGEGQVDAFAPLLGRYSLLVGQQNIVIQWSLIRDEGGYRFQDIRQFDFPAPVRLLRPEQRRKGFVAIDTAETAHFAFATSGRITTEAQLPAGTQVLGISPRAHHLLASAPDGELATFTIDNRHPDIGWRTLLGKVWYEGYAEPIFSWQSSSAGNDFEAKFSLVPLIFGTLKAALYAMLVATPLAILGAMYTAFFMAPAMRRIVKPGIEVMAALPTVVLGFLAGLWLAPLIEANLAALLCVLFLVPLGLLLLAWLWRYLPDRITRPCQGWYALLAIGPIVALFWLAFQLGGPLERVLFDGSLRDWMLNELGIAYDQRNALIVGIAMGMAVVPTIFSIAEDAIYGVPRNLINGSLALGATPWQTLTRVVLLTASPGLFSAVMIGFGRAVGETMIVLMATGNTPIMDWNIFQGMRTFAANIAVEMPEAEVGSSHFRILFLTALLLFLLTFVVNSVAEFVRQRLRARYGSL